MTSKDLASYLLKHLRELLKNREQVLKDKRTFRVRYTEETSEILQEFLKEDMSVTEKALAAILKNIGTAFHTIGVRLALGPSREYSIVKTNYFYGKAGKDIEEWLAKIDWMIEANNMADGRRVAVAAAYLRDVVAE